MKQQADPDTPKNKYWFIYGLILVVILGAALALRILPLHSVMFSSGWTNMQGPDGIYHLRLVENLLAHFPFRISFDPYTYFPNGQLVYFAPLYDWLAGFCAWVVGAGSPDQHTIEVVAAYFPAVLGALVTIPVYFIGKTLWNRTAGLISTLIVGVFPGTFLYRSRLGYFDHHVAEVLFSTLFMLFLFLTLNHVKVNPIYFRDIRIKNWRLYAKPLIFACLCGIALGSYLLVWVGGLFFVFLFFCWAVLTFVIEHLKKQSTDYIGIVGIPVFLLSLLMVIPSLDQIAYSELYVFSLLTGLLGLLVLFAISKYMDIKNFRRIYFPLSIVAIGIIGFIVLHLFFPSTAGLILNRFQIFKPDINGLTVAEQQPFLFSQGKFTLAPLWNEFTTGAVVVPIAFVMILVGFFKTLTSGKTLLLLWSVMMFLATMGQVRFAYYLAVVFAVLSGYFYAEIVNLIKKFFNWLFLRPLKGTYMAVSHTKHKQRELARSIHENKLSPRQGTSHPHSSRAGWARLSAFSVSLILVFLVGVYPNLGPAITLARTNVGVSQDWRDSLLWMKDNTPEPFQNPVFYYKLYEKPSDEKYAYPASAYGVMAWWDYGHMITEVAHRIPNANPNQFGAASAGRYFVSQNELEADRLLDELGTKYVIVNFDIAIPFNIVNNTLVGKKFYAMPTWAGKDPSEYCDIFFQQKNNQLIPVPMYYPEYYYCLSTRLYNFHGTAVVPENSTTVISFVQQSGRKVIQSSQTFPSYEEASKFLSAQSSPNFRLVGTSPFSSPVPLDKLAHYKEVYRSSYGIIYNNQKINASTIEIFEYLP
jgi:dolichyl-phosphooligosaccharide-protein glycotransferase